MTKLTNEQIILLVVILVAGYYLYNRYEGFNVGARIHHRYMHRWNNHRIGGRHYNFNYLYEQRPFHHRVRELIGYGYPYDHYLAPEYLNGRYRY